MSSSKKPTLDEVLAYAEPQIKSFISKKALDLPFEQIEEILQEGFIRIIGAYESLDADQGWKSFVYNHSRGAVLDYLKAGHGFHESRWSIAKDEEHESRSVSKIRDRLSLVSKDGDTLEVDSILGSHGVFEMFENEDIKIRWELVSRMASKDEGINAFCRLIQGFSLEEIALNVGLSRARVGQVIEDFLKRFDDPKENEKVWFLQTCYAFGLCKTLGMPDKDQGKGWTFDRRNIFDTMPLDPMKQLDFFVEIV